MPSNDLSNCEASPLFRGPWSKLSEIEPESDSLVTAALVEMLQYQSECLKLLWMRRKPAIIVREPIGRVPSRFAGIPLTPRHVCLTDLMNGNSRLQQFTSDGGPSDHQVF